MKLSGEERGHLGYRIGDLLRVSKQTDDGSSGDELSRTDRPTSGSDAEDVDPPSAGGQKNPQL